MILVFEKLNVLKNLFCLFIICLILSCSNNKSSVDCDVPAPEAIFSKNIEQITSHSFSLKDHLAKEIISFDNGVELEIFQSGCEKIVQEFVFEVPNEQIEANQHTQQAIRQLKFISSLDAKYLAFDQWAQAIQELEIEFFKSDAVEVSPGFIVRLDRIKGSKSHKILIRLSQS